MSNQSHVKFNKGSLELEDDGEQSSSASCLSDELTEDENLRDLDDDSDFRRTIIDEKSAGTPTAENFYQDPRFKKLIIREVRKLEQLAIDQKSQIKLEQVEKNLFCNLFMEKYRSVQLPEDLAATLGNTDERKYTIRRSSH